jgi:hypothetical protein
LDISWNPNATTFAGNTTIGSKPYALFISTKNTIVVPRRDTGQILVWHDTTGTSTTKITAALASPFSVFMTGDDEIFVDKANAKGQVDRWALNGTLISSSFFLCSQCYGLFVDVDDHLYCSVYERHQVVRQSLESSSGSLTIVAGEIVQDWRMIC